MFIYLGYTLYNILYEYHKRKLLFDDVESEIV